MDRSCTCHAFGIYRGQVSDVNDPENLMRVKVTVPQIFGPTPLQNWAWPCVDVDAITVPPLGTPVWIMFVGGDVEHPVWLGTWKTV